MTKLKLIVCCDKMNGIGKNGLLPWSIPSEMKLFKEKTIGNGNNCVIMGKNTYLSIPENFRPLKQRMNCILTSTMPTNTTNYHTLTTIEQLISWIQQTSYDEYWIIGGEMLYANILHQYKHLIDEIHLSKLNDNYQCDSFFDHEIVIQNFTLASVIQYQEFTHMVFNRLQNKDYLQ